jgi:hypothetical protein
MSDAFSRAATAVHGDKNLSRAITYTPAATRTGLAAQTIRGVFSRPIEPDQGMGGRGMMLAPVSVSILLASLPYPPLKGDTVTDGTTTWRVDRVERDLENLEATCVLVATA